jgi:2-hydroxychromene-2-carboxylate isomerase
MAFPLVPAPYRLAEWDTANRLAVLAATERWTAGYTQATYRRWFQEGVEPGSEANLSKSLREIGQDPSRVTALAATPGIGTAYETATGGARDLGIFGSPTFRVRRELFWGDDRLDDAIAWYRRGTLAGAQSEAISTHPRCYR